MSIIVKIETHEAILKSIFENFRNIGICVVILTAAQWTSTNESNTWPFYSQSGVIALFITGIVLFLANGIHGFVKIWRAELLKPGKSLIAFLYITASLQIFFTPLLIKCPNH